jgi:uncharacterized protein (DUF983 family)
MSDEVDLANDLADMATQDAIRKAAKPLARGVAGDCDLCGEWSGRLIGGACAPCRDRYKLA